MKSYPDETVTSFPLALPYILLIEGDEGIASLLHTVLTEELNWQTLRTSTARAALQTMHDLKPALLVMNHHLPDGDGIDLYDSLHAKPSFATIPALLLSTNSEECFDRIEGRQLHFLSIPCELEEMIEAFQRILTPIPEGC